MNLINEKKEAHKTIREIVTEAETQLGNQYIVLEKPSTRYLIWQALMPRADMENILYVVYQKSSGAWNVLAMRSDLDSFSSRKALPTAWQGLSGDTLVRVSAVPDAIFCHRSGFLASAKTREGAVALAEKACAL